MLRLQRQALKCSGLLVPDDRQANTPPGQPDEEETSVMITVPIRVATGFANEIHQFLVIVGLRPC